MVNYNGKTYSKAVTKNGRFNSQQVMCASLLRLIDPEITIKRSATPTLEKGSLVFGISTLIPPEYRENNVRYDCFGYLWKQFCHHFPLTEKQILGFDRDICIPLDLSAINPDKRSPIDILFNSFNKRITDAEDRDGFEEAVEVGTRFLSAWLETAYAANYARNLVKDALSKSTDSRILILPCAVPFSALPAGTMYVAYPSVGGQTYTVHSILQPDGSQPLFPAEWCHSSNLPTGIKFCNSKRDTIQVKGDKYILQACYVALLSASTVEDKKEGGAAG